MVFSDNEIYVLNMEISLSFVFVNDSQAHMLFSAVKMVHLLGHDAIWREVCHDLKEILWVPIFLLYFIIIFVKHGIYVSGTGAQFLLMVDSKLHLF